ncbi:MAG: hypothetical protein ACFE0Q_15120 [Anaerolineae bacterium]
MNFDQVKKFLKDGYERNGFDVVAEPPNGEAELRYPQQETYDVTLRITTEDVEEYSKLMQARGEFVPISNTGLANRNFRESLVIPLDPGIDIRDVDDLFFKRAGDEKTYVEIDTISLVFANYFRFEPAYMNLCLDRLFTLPKPIRQASAKQALDVRKIFAHPLSVRVYHIGAHTTDEAIERSDELINGALFTLAHEIGIPLMLANHYPSSRYEYVQKIKTNNHKMHHITLPDSNFRHDLVRFYQVGLASPIATQQFLSFYQALELFFQDVSHVGVYDELYHLLRSETFKPDNGNLARIVSLVEANKREVNNADLLEQLIRQHVQSDAIKQVILDSGTVVEETVRTLAQRITATRDAIMLAGVHGLPVDDASVAKDVPLVRFLTEQVILATRAE